MADFAVLPEIQAHSRENRIFKSDRITVGDRATVGVAALAHYGTTIGEHGILEADSLLMKGSEIAVGARWRGDPAGEVIEPARRLPGATAGHLPHGPRRAHPQAPGARLPRAVPGPGGANAVEAALDVARKATGRTDILHFTNGFHRISLGALAVTGNGTPRAAARIPLSNATPLPHDGAPDTAKRRTSPGLTG